MKTEDPEFNAYAEHYETLLKDPIRDAFAPGSVFFHERKLLLMINHLQRSGFDPQTLSWLDIGCGKGDLLKLGKSRFQKAAGCDFSEQMLNHCGGVETRVQTVPDQLPFESESFDFVTAVCVYHHVESHQRGRFTSEAARVLRPGGIFAVIEHNPFNPATRLIVSRTPVDANAELLTSMECRKVLTSNGFSKPETTFFLYFPEKLYRRLKSVEALLSRVPMGGQYAIFCRTQP